MIVGGASVGVEVGSVVGEISDKVTVRESE